MLSKQKFIEAKVQGKDNTRAALEAGSKTIKAAHKAGYRLSNNVQIQSELQKLLKKQGITLKKALAPIADALTATKVHVVGNGDQAMAEIVTDHPTRLKASSMALDLLGIKNKQQLPQAPLDTGAITKALRNLDDVELQRIVFNKKTDDKSS